MSKVLIVKNKDKRMEYLKHYLESRLDVCTIDDELQLFYEIQEESSEVLILPVRGVKKDLTIDGTNICLTDNYLNIFKNKVIYTGLISEELKEKCEKNQILLKSYLTDDLAIKNNYITTEGIIEAIVNQSDKAIFNSKILIIGYGRLGQICANIMKALKANVTISCRHEKDLLHAKIQDYNVINYQQIVNEINQFDFIINTVPYRLIDPTLIRKLNKNESFIIDVASSPYGLDHEYAKNEGIKTLLLPGIPGKIAPKTAGELVGASIYQDIVGGEAKWKENCHSR